MEYGKNDFEHSTDDLVQWISDFKIFSDKQSSAVNDTCLLMQLPYWTT